MSQSGEVESSGDEVHASAGTEAGRAALPLVFTGNARDYFRLWIVNLCLTLFTFGIFSAWAKVRRKRYFYSHTELDGTPFQYLANPIPILKGRVMGAFLLALWYAGTHFSLRLLLVVLGLAAVLAPWVMVRTAAFNARYSAYRNMTFHFAGSYGGAALTLLTALMLVVATCGLGYPWAYTRVRRYVVENTSFGGVRARYLARGGHLITPYYLAFGGTAVVGIALALVAKEQAHLGRWVTPSLVVAYVAYGVSYAYLGARIGRVNWGASSLGPLGFFADYRARDFISIYFTNALAILCSLGLLIPWAAVRMHRYRVEKMGLERTGSLAVFAGQRDLDVRATGAEVADLFDFDLSL